MSANSFEDRVKIFETGEIVFGAHTGGSFERSYGESFRFYEKNLL